MTHQMNLAQSLKKHMESANISNCECANMLGISELDFMEKLNTNLFTIREIIVISNKLALFDD